MASVSSTARSFRRAFEDCAPRGIEPGLALHQFTAGETEFPLFGTLEQHLQHLTLQAARTLRRPTSGRLPVAEGASHKPAEASVGNAKRRAARAQSEIALVQFPATRDEQQVMASVQDSMEDEKALDMCRHAPPSLLVGLDGFGGQAQHIGHVSLRYAQFLAQAFDRGHLHETVYLR